MDQRRPALREPLLAAWAGSVRTHASAVLLSLLLALLASGGLLRAFGASDAHAVWIAATAVGVAASALWVTTAALHRRIGADLLALLALVGALVVREYLAGAVIAVMLASGRELEAWAAGRSARQLRLLVDRAPRTANRVRAGRVEQVPVDTVAPGEDILVRPGEVVPVDGVVRGVIAILDESALTGEPVPVEHPAGDLVRSGAVNAGSPFELRVTTAAAQSTYAGIVRLVATAQTLTAPTTRLADRYAGRFLGVSLVLAGASWALSGDLTRAVAVLVVATPCPLILAVPVALISGLARAAQRGVVIKGGGVLERLATASVLLLDKTGTLTAGHPAVAGIVTRSGHTADDVLRLAASVDQTSPHVLATAVVRAAKSRGLDLVVADEVTEEAGHGVRGLVDGVQVAVGKAGWVGESDAGWLRTVRRRAAREGMLTVFVGVAGQLAGALLLDDPVRADAARTIRHLRRSGIRRVVLVTGDRAEIAETVGAVIGADDVFAERTPAEKVEAVRFERRNGPTIMVGDGINDAPALALADVGVAIGARGATASSEAADVVIMDDRIDRVGEAMAVAKRARRIAGQSVAGGIGLSVAAMIAAAFGVLPPTYGALLQEVIDVAAITNALRVLRARTGVIRLRDPDAALARRFAADHAALAADVEKLRTAADAIDVLPDDEALAAVRAAYAALVTGIGAHERAEDEELYPLVARALGGADPTAPMSRTHIEIAHLTRLIGAALPADPHDRIDREELAELRRLLYALHAILRLHNAQEEENYLSLADLP